MRPTRTRAKPRPPNWGTNLALELVTSGQAMKPQLQALAGPCGLSWRTLYADIHRWRKGDPDFAEAYSSAGGAGGATGRSAGRPPLELTEGMEDWKDRWLEEYARCGKRMEASQRVGVSWSHVYNMTREGHVAYDADFAEKFEEVRRLRLGLIEDEVIEIIHTGQERNRLWGALKYLESQDPERFGKQVEMRVSGRVDHRHERRYTREEALEIMSRDFARVLGERKPEAVEIEAEGVSVKRIGTGEADGSG